ncbi:MAG: hypothetical protein LLG04_12070 [Parachlamydia sp.]|nr:hypothetical protein [Parachlamydia sp.]
MATVLIHSGVISSHSHIPPATPYPKTATTAPARPTPEAIVETVKTVFAEHTGEIDRETAKLYLDDAREVTILTLNGSSYLARGALVQIAQTLPKLSEFRLNTDAKGLQNAVTDQDLKKFAELRPNIQKLTLNRLSNVTTEGFLGMIQKLHDLVEFATDYPVTDAHVQALQEGNRTLQKWHFKSVANLSSHYRFLVSGK